MRLKHLKFAKFAPQRSKIILLVDLISGSFMGICSLSTATCESEIILHSTKLEAVCLYNYTSDYTGNYSKELVKLADVHTNAKSSVNLQTTDPI